TAERTSGPAAPDCCCRLHGADERTAPSELTPATASRATSSQTHSASERRPAPTHRGSASSRTDAPRSQGRRSDDRQPRSARHSGACCRGLFAGQEPAVLAAKSRSKRRERQRARCFSLFAEKTGNRPATC